MSAPVDVLAVLDDTAAMLRAIAPAVCDRLSGLHRDAQQITCARAAVAELLHYGSKIEQRRRGVLHGDEDAVAQDWAEFRAALARCGGAP